VGYIVPFDGEEATVHEMVGGKGANLGRMTAAGFPVPPGFTVSTAAYAELLESGGRNEAIRGLLAEIDYADADSVASATESIRRHLIEGEMPQGIQGAVLDAYASLDGQDSPVAVRSSGTAEDLEGTSFAGLHDTYLDVRGGGAVIDAIHRCWASLWSARATSYRHDNEFDHLEAKLAVVVQTMVPSESAGVMFTANPVTGAVSEIVINASWGLGEAVVSGLVTPDEYALDRDTKRVKRFVAGDKERRIVRDPERSGTIEEEVPIGERQAPTLSDDQAARLADLGSRLTEYYEGFPQDIEWGYADGDFYLLQTRPVTGVELSWDEDLEYFHFGSEEDPDRDDFVYTRAWSDDFSIAAITPLYYTTRSKEWSDNYHAGQVLWGHEEAAALRSWKYHKGEAYFSSNMEAAWIPRTLPKYLREPGTLNKLPPSWWAEVEAAPFSWVDYLRTYARIQFLDGRSGPYKYVAAFQERIDREEEANGLPDEQLRHLSDDAFRRYLNGRLDLWRDADADQWAAFFLYAPFAMGTLANFLVRWYRGDIAQAFAELLSGLDEPSITLIENHEIWQLGEKIKASPKLRSLLDEFQGAAFFEELANHEEGREFLAEYEPWRIKRGHRGAADRDFILPRRLDDPSIDYNAFVALMAGDGVDPLENEVKNRETRHAREEDVYADISRGPLGSLKLEGFKLLQSWSLDFMAHRDNEREYLDRLAYAQRRCFIEMGRRLAERGRIEETMDVFFLGLEEAYELMGNDRRQRLMGAKIDGRKRNFLRRQSLDVVLPPYIGTDGGPALPGEQIGTLSSTEATEEDGRTVMSGAGTSSGKITGRARVIKNMEDIGQLEKGDILICHATDPGWTPVFLVIGGLVMQTGGVLAHGSCLSREYGLPALVLPEAMSRVPDRATVTIDGDVGRVEIHKEEIGSETNVVAAAG
jgi:rifampicin phosphotransferase